MEVLKVKKFIETAILPKKTNPTDAGYDLSSINDYIILPNTSQLINTGIGFTVPSGTYGRIAPRSGLSTKNIFVNGGVIDEGYRNEVKVILYNGSKSSYIVKQGDRIAQLILEKIVSAEIQEVVELESSDRDVNGFGSSGA